jgi:hypothetical protein
VPSRGDHQDRGVIPVHPEACRLCHLGRKHNA